MSFPAKLGKDVPCIGIGGIKACSGSVCIIPGQASDWMNLQEVVIARTGSAVTKRDEADGQVDAALLKSEYK